LVVGRTRLLILPFEKREHLTVDEDREADG
jgi:hypothetical protein